LRVVVRRLLDFLAASAPVPALADLSYTLQSGREAMTSRLAMVVRDHTELRQGLTAFLQAAPGPPVASIPIFTGNTAEDQDLEDLLASEVIRQVFLKERHLEKLALYWTRGGDIPWETLHEDEPPRLLTLPTYPFARERYWLAASAAEGHAPHLVADATAPITPASTAHERARTFLVHFLCRELHLTAEQVQPHRNLRDYGTDSITAMRLIRAVEKDFHVHMSGRDLLEHQTMHALSTYLAARIDAPQAAGTALTPSLSEKEEEPAAVTPTALDSLDQFKQGLLTLEAMEAMLEQGKMV
jgi:acyl transferase domain-containing protein